MKYFELLSTVYIKESFDFKDSFEIISKYISFSLSKDDKYLKKHQLNEYKSYTFASFIDCKTKKPKKIKKGELLCFIIRTIDEELAKKLPKLLEQNSNNSYFRVVNVDKRVQKKFMIADLYTITPTIITINKEDGYWSVSKNGDIILLTKRLHENLIKKYKQFYGEIEENSSFIQRLEIKNKTPQFITMHKSGHKIKLFGNKFHIIPNDDDVSQKLAFLAMSIGLGEKNTLGGGFCVGRRVGL